ncbi:unnamed protein product [marine sediment metagenome]|uniref:Glycosyltransferase 2-like domain-containing protein n=1 Tax=marine sediment metagenome TaxID=412755 RepID=X1JM30_9ZZZZ
MALSNKLVSIILPTRNSAEFVPKLIKGIKAQTYHKIECINIDNFSKDILSASALKCSKICGLKMQ